MLALQGDSDGEIEVGGQADGGPAVPGLPADDLPGVEPGGLLAELVILFDGLITNGKFCCVRQVRLSLTWWRRPLGLRRSALHTDVALVGDPDDPDLDRLPPVQPAPGRRAPVGSGLPAAGASRRTLSGLSRSACDRYDRGGCPLNPGTVVRSRPATSARPDPPPSSGRPLLPPPAARRREC